MKKIIAIAGKAEAGKDTFALFMEKYFKKTNKKVLIMHFADELKFYAKKYFGWNEKKDKPGRELLQQLGTNIVRSKNINYWVESIARFINIFYSEFDYFILADCRFPNEIDFLKQNKFPTISIRINRPNHENSLTTEQRLHLSETALDNYKFDYIIDTDEGLDKLEIEVDKFISAFNL